MHSVFQASLSVPEDIRRSLFQFFQLDGGSCCRDPQAATEL